jgi:hypothetical protein
VLLTSKDTRPAGRWQVQGLELFEPVSHPRIRWPPCSLPYRPSRSKTHDSDVPITRDILIRRGLPISSRSRTLPRFNALIQLGEFIVLPEHRQQSKHLLMSTTTFLHLPSDLRYTTRFADIRDTQGPSPLTPLICTLPALVYGILATHIAMPFV